MSKASDTLTWLDSNRVAVEAHPGAAYEEVEILRLMLSGASGTGGVFSAAYRAKLAIHVPELNDRAQAREYAHYVMFASDFGLDPVMHPIAVNALLNDAVVTHASDSDTLGELLIACHLLGHTSIAIESARVAFDAAWIATERVFNNYHVILIGGILYALRGE